MALGCRSVRVRSPITLPGGASSPAGGSWGDHERLGALGIVVVGDPLKAGGPKLLLSAPQRLPDLVRHSDLDDRRGGRGGTAGGSGHGRGLDGCGGLHQPADQRHRGNPDDERRDGGCSTRWPAHAVPAERSTANAPDGGVARRSAPAPILRYEQSGQQHLDQASSSLTPAPEHGQSTALLSAASNATPTPAPPDTPFSRLTAPS